MPITLNAAWVNQNIPRRQKTAHKGTFGTLTIVAGSRLYRGAASLAVSAALRAGMGIVRLASIEPVCAAVAVQQPCCVFLPLAESPGGGIAAAGVAAVLQQKSTAILAGCGLVNSPDTAQIIQLLLGSGLPLVLDADALNVIAGHFAQETSKTPPQALSKALQAAAGPLILTPHIGEMARLCRLTVQQVQAEQEEVALRFAKAHHCVTVLKSHETVVATAQGEVYKTAFGGNSGLAKGGSGDVLAGIIAALLAQGLPAGTAAAAGVWLHAQAGAIAAARHSQPGMTPADIPAALCEVWRQLKR